METKKTISVVLLLLLFSVSAFSEETAWRKETYKTDEGTSCDRYTLNLPKATCIINVVGDEIEAIGIDFDWDNRTVVDCSTINLDGVQFTRVIQSSSNSPNPRYSNDGYWVFESKCTPESGLLPSEIRKLFRGYLGVK